MDGHSILVLSKCCLSQNVVIFLSEKDSKNGLLWLYLESDSSAVLSIILTLNPEGNRSIYTFQGKALSTGSNKRFQKSNV